MIVHSQIDGGFGFTWMERMKEWFDTDHVSLISFNVGRVMSCLLKGPLEEYAVIGQILLKHS